MLHYFVIQDILDAGSIRQQNLRICHSKKANVYQERMEIVFFLMLSQANSA